MDVFISWVVRMLLPVALLVALAMLVKSYQGGGDGFSAGLVAALAVLLLYAAEGTRAARALPLVRHARGLAGVGVLLLLAVAFGPLLAGLPPVSHLPPPGAHVVRLGTLELHTALLFDLGVALVVLGLVVTTVDLLALQQEEDP